MIHFDVPSRAAVLAVERRGRLQRDERQARHDVAFERRVQPAGRRLEDAGLDLDAGCSRGARTPGRRPRGSDRRRRRPPERRRHRRSRSCTAASVRRDRRARACSRGWRRGPGRPPRRAHGPRRAAFPDPRASPHRPRRPSRTTTAPTMGLGDTRPRPSAASSSARRMCRSCSTCAASSPGILDPSSGARWERRAARGPARCAEPPPRLLPSRLSRSVPESHRIHPHVAREGSRTVTAGGESHPALETSYPWEVYERPRGEVEGRTDAFRGRGGRRRRRSRRHVWRTASSPWPPRRPRRSGRTPAGPSSRSRPRWRPAARPA